MDQSRIWYVVVQSKAEGPFTLEEMKTRVKKGEMGPIDYVFKPGLKNWTKAEEFPEFFDDGTAKALSKVTEPPKMSSTPEAPLAVTPAPAPVLAPPVTAVAEIAPVIASAPVVVATAAAPVSAPIPKTHASEEVTKTVEVSTINPSASADPLPEPSSETPSKWSAQKVRYAVAGAAAVLAMAILWTAFHKVPPTESAVTTVAPPPSSPPAVAPPVAQQPPAPQAAIPEAPKTFKILTLKGATNNPQLAFEGNFTTDKMLVVEVTAEPGQILKYMSFSVKKEVLVQPGSVPTLDLTHLRLPAGRYTVVAKKGGEVTQTKMDIGVQNEQFKQQLALFQRTVKEKRQKEKRFLASCSKELNSQMRGLNAIYKGKQGAAWTKSYNNWKQDMKQMVSRLPQIKDKNTYVYGDLLHKAVLLHKDLAALGAEVNSKVKSSGVKRQMASVAAQKTGERALQLKQSLSAFDKEIKSAK